MSVAKSKFEAVESVRLSDSVFRQVFQLIAGGKLLAGERLPPERELAATLGVSRSSVREGLHALDQLGLVSIRQGSGAFVMKHTWRAGSGMLWLPWLVEHGEQVLEIVEAREVIEPAIASLAATKIDAKDREDLVQLHTLFGASISANAFEEAVIADNAFHARIAHLASNKLLEMLVRSMHEIIHRDIAGPYHFEDLIGRQAIEEHEAILDALLTNDADRAGKAMRTHLSNVRSTFKTAIRNAQSPATMFPPAQDGDTGK